MSSTCIAARMAQPYFQLRRDFSRPLLCIAENVAGKEMQQMLTVNIVGTI